MSRTWDELQPGDTGTVVIKLNTAGKKGWLRQWGVVVTDSPEMPFFKGNLVGLVRSAWSRPEAIDLGTVYSGEEREARFTVFAAGYPRIRVTEVESDKPRVVSAELLETRPPHEDAAVVEPVGVILVRWLGATEQAGRCTGTVSVALTDGVESRELKIPIDAYVVGMMDATPSRVFFGRLEPGRTAQKTVRLKWRKGKHYEIGQIALSASHEFVQAQLTQRPDEQGDLRLSVAVQLPPDAAGIVEGDVVAMAGNVGVFAVPYTFYVLSDPKGDKSRGGNGELRAHPTNSARAEPSGAPEQQGR